MVQLNVTSNAIADDKTTESNLCHGDHVNEMVVKIPWRTHNVRMTAQLYDIIHEVWILLLSHRSRQAEKRPSSGGRLVNKYGCWKWCWLEKKSMTMVKNLIRLCLSVYNLSYNDHGKTLQLFTLNLTQYKQISLEQFRPERNFWWTRKWRFKVYWNEFNIHNWILRNEFNLKELFITQIFNNKHNIVGLWLKKVQS